MIYRELSEMCVMHLILPVMYDDMCITILNLLGRASGLGPHYGYDNNCCVKDSNFEGLSFIESSRVWLRDDHFDQNCRGFWSAYLPARYFLHELLRKELTTNPAKLYFTGHSLGGALTTLAAYDFSIHSLPRINQYLAAKKKLVVFH